MALVGLESDSLVMPRAEKTPNGPLDQKRHVPADKAGVPSCKLHFPTEGEVVADENLCAGGDASVLVQRK
jgi:hypothetical protein